MFPKGLETCLPIYDGKEGRWTCRPEDLCTCRPCLSYFGTAIRLFHRNGNWGFRPSCIGRKMQAGGSAQHRIPPESDQAKSRSRDWTGVDPKPLSGRSAISLEDAAMNVLMRMPNCRVKEEERPCGRHLLQDGP